MQETSLQADILPFAQSCVAHGLTIESARDLLDWLEANGINNAHVEVDATGHLTILLKC